MSRRLLRIHPDGSRSWPQAGDSGRGRGGGPLWVVVPAEDVLLLETRRITTSTARMAQALPYAIEDQLAVPVETQHVAWASLPDPGLVAVAVVARERMQAWLDALAQDGLQPDVLVPEGLLLPWREGRCTVLCEPRRVLLRLGRCRVFCGAPDEVTSLLPAESERLDVVTVDTEAPVEGALSRRVGDALEVYAAEIDAGAAPMINLLQGDFAPRQARRGVRRAWMQAAVAAAVAVTLATGHLALERQRLAAEVERQRAEMASLYRQLVPGEGAVASPEAFLASALAAAGQAEAPALELLTRLGAALVASACCELQALDYRNRVLDAVVTAPDVASLDALRGRLVEVGIRAELTAATPGSRGVEGRLRLGGGSE